jgi:hypothetical protein
MPFYRVYDTSHTAKRVALRDDVGRFHLASITAELPSIGEELEGEAPQLGFRVLMSPDGQAFRAIFESLDCGARSALQDLHP